MQKSPAPTQHSNLISLSAVEFHTGLFISLGGLRWDTLKTMQGLQLNLQSNMFDVGNNHSITKVHAWMKWWQHTLITPVGSSLDTLIRLVLVVPPIISLSAEPCNSIEKGQCYTFEIPIPEANMHCSFLFDVTFSIYWLHFLSSLFKLVGISWHWTLI